MSDLYVSQETDFMEPSDIAKSLATKFSVIDAVREIDKDALLGYLKNSPQTAFNMMQQLASYARNANEKLSPVDELIIKIRINKRNPITII